MKKIHFNNRIWILAALVLLAVVSAVGAGSAFTSALALEQTARCGMEEHVHTEECYVGDILVCDKKMHTHTENCYLVLLEDNDINTLLTQVDQTEDKSLESVIRNTVVQAVALSQSSGSDSEDGSSETDPSPSPSLDPSIIPSLTPTPTPTPTPTTGEDEEGKPITNEDIVQLNAVAAANDVQPRVTLNESLVIQTASEDSMSEEELLAALLLSEKDSGSSTYAANGGSSTYAVGQDPVTGNRVINFYIRLDDEIKCIGNATLTKQQQNYYYTYANTVNLYKGVVETNLSTTNINNGYYFLYNTTGITTSTTNFNTPATYQNSYVYFGNVNNTRYAILSSTNTSTTPVDFYTLTLDYSAIGTSNDTKYVETGYNYSLPSLSTDYHWEDASGTTITSISLTAATTVYARPNNVTVTFEYPDGSTTTQTVTDRSVTMPDGYSWADETTEYMEGETVSVTKDTTFVGTKLYTVTLNFPDGTVTSVRAKSGVEYALPEGYIWKDEGGNEVSGSITVTGDVTLTATKAHTVTYTYQDGNMADQTFQVPDGGSHTVQPVKSGYVWFKDGVLFTASTIDSVTGDIELIGKKICTMTLKDADGNTTAAYTVYEGGSFTLPDLPEGYTVWLDMDTGDSYAAGETISDITRDYSFRAASTVTVTYIDKDGIQTTQSVTPGNTVTLTDPGSGYLWVDDQSISYSGGDTVKITRDTTFTARPALNVSYNVNFPTTAPTGFAYTVTLPASPTVSGATTTTVTDLVAQGTSAAIRDVSERKVVAETAHPKGLDYPLYFKGWQASDGTILSPGTRLTYDELEAYASGGTVPLTGVWEYATNHTVNFCIAYSSQPTIGGGDKTYYTDNLYTTYLGGSNIDTSYSLPLPGTVVDTSNPTDQELYESDRQFRALYGSSGDMWLYDLPNDEDVFAQIAALIEGGATFYVKDELVSAGNLDADHYAIRWSVFFYADSNDGWHVDGRLVKKSGSITVDKTFEGDATYIAKGKDGFTIVAQNGYKDAGGNFVPYDPGDSAYKSYQLTLNDATQTGVNSYEWVIDGLALNELWQVVENPPEPDGTYSYYAEYSVYDSDGEVSAVAEYGTEAKVVGKVFALDEDPDQGLKISYVNYYYPSDSLLIKKEDAETGQAIPNVRFEVVQKGQTLRFNLDEGTGYYTQDPGGEYPYITTGADGYTAIRGFSSLYDEDDPSIIVREYQAPTGYQLAPAVKLTWGEAGETSTVYISDVDGIKSTDWNAYAEYSASDGVLVVKNYPKTISLTAHKVWADETRESSVKLILQANGKRATDLFPTLSNVEVTLSAANNWTWTWTDLPVSANGATVEWSVRESAIGSEVPIATTGADGQITYSYARWIVSYSPPVKTDSDGDGLAESWEITVTNTLRRAMLYLNKVSAGTLNALPGAEFRLVQVDAAGAEVSGTEKTAVTADNGTLNFDNLTYGVRYCLTEVSAPDGYWDYTDPIYFTITEDGKVNLEESNEYVSSGSAPYNVTVTNRSVAKLPETGGGGTNGYYAAGVMLMLLALCVAILPKFKKKGRYRMRR